MPNLNELFKHQQPSKAGLESIGEVRAGCLALASLIERTCPTGADRERAIVHVRQAMMFANDSIEMEGEG